MKYIKNARAFLVSAVIVCICVRVVFWAIEPLLPYLLGGLILLTIVGVAVFRSTRF
jgi:fatty acid desaturase